MSKVELILSETIHAASSTLLAALAANFRPGLFFGIGTGEHAPALHTDGFAFDDTLLPRILQVWLSVIGL